MEPGPYRPCCDATAFVWSVDIEDNIGMLPNVFDNYANPRVLLIALISSSDIVLYHCYASQPLSMPPKLQKERD